MGVLEEGVTFVGVVLGVTWYGCVRRRSNLVGVC